MITKTDCINIILKRIPAFRKHWQAHLEYWEDEEAGLCNDMAAFTNYVLELIAHNHIEGLPTIFDLTEQLMIEGDLEVRDAVATCFLENLLNATASQRISANRFVGFLGPESRAYCKAWDEFTGVCTEGL